MKIKITNSNRKRKNKHGFFKRMKSKNGRAVLARRRRKGRKVLSAQSFLNFSISKKNFSSALYKSNVFVFKNLKIYYKQCHKNKIGFIVSRSFGPASKRNLFKRRCRSVFLNHTTSNSCCFSVVVKPIKSNNINFFSINEAFNNFLNMKV